MIYRRASLAAGLAAIVTAGLGILAATSAPQPAQAAATSGGVKFAYFAQWGIYSNAFYPKTMHTSGMADKLDFVVYAFENIHPANLTCFEATKAADQNESNPNAGDGAADAFADYQKSFGADISVDGVADVWNQPIAGNFNQLKKLKALHPNLKIVLSLGGWTYSKYFSDAAATDARRKALVSSCIDMFLKGNLPVDGGFGGPGTAAGIFDGIDIDWEYPGIIGHTGNHFTAADKQNFTLLLAEFRAQLDAYGASVGKRMYLTAAVPAGQDKLAHIETNKIGNYLDYANVMTYDMHGAWDAQGPANHQAPLYTAPNDPSNPIPPGTGKYGVDEAVKAWTAGAPAYGIPGGFPANKLTIGYPLYYRGWTGVQAGANHGLYMAATGPAAGHAQSGNVPGVSFYKELTGFVDNPAFTYWDDVTKSSYFYDGSTFWTGDNARSIQAKADYQHCNGLAGAMMYSMEADPNAVLFNAVVNATNGTTPGCVGPSPTASTGPSASASPSASRSPSAGPSTSPSTGCTVAAWSATQVYTNGMSASYNGRKYTAKWWTQNERPDLNSGDGKPWTDNGPCGTASASPSSSPSASASPSVSPSRSPSASPSPSGTGTYPAWAPNVAYTAGTRVSYGGKNYQCLQVHTSLVGWEPPNVPALWQQIA